MINSYTTYIKQTMVSTLLQKEHEFEHRRWIPEWGPKQPPEPAVGGSENWQVIMEPAPAADDPFFRTIPVAEAGRMASCTSRWRLWTTLNDRHGGSAQGQS